jgi:cytoskeletal protein RodZ
MIGIGPALRDAREQTGKTLDEASRDTKIRAEYLQALEGESFDALLGDVYVRGFLRSYSQYLGLDPDKVLAAYSRSMGEHEPTEPPPVIEPDRPASPAHPTDRRRSWKLAALATVGILAVIAVLGLLSRSHSTPAPVGLPSVVPSVVATDTQVSVGLIAKHVIPVTVTADGEVIFSGTLQAQEARSFEAVSLLTVQLGRGGVVTIRHNGVDLGAPGSKSQPYEASFGPEVPSQSRSQSSAPSAEASP